MCTVPVLEGEETGPLLCCFQHSEVRDSHSSPSPHHLTGPDADTGAADKAAWPPRGAQPLAQPGDPSPAPGESPAAPAFQVPEPGRRSHFLTF